MESLHSLRQSPLKGADGHYTKTVISRNSFRKQGLIGRQCSPASSAYSTPLSDCSCSAWLTLVCPGLHDVSRRYGTRDGKSPELSNPLSCQLGPKEAPPGSRIEPGDGLNPKSLGMLAIPQTTSFRPCSRGARAGDNSGGLTTQRVNPSILHETIGRNHRKNLGDLRFVLR